MSPVARSICAMIAYALIERRSSSISRLVVGSFRGKSEVRRVRLGIGAADPSAAMGAERRAHLRSRGHAVWMGTSGRSVLHRSSEPAPLRGVSESASQRELCLVCCCGGMGGELTQRSKSSGVKPNRSLFAICGMVEPYLASGVHWHRRVQTVRAEG